MPFFKSFVVATADSNPKIQRVGEFYLAFIVEIARKANSYECKPKPPIVPFTTPETTDVCRNYSLDNGFERCTSITGAFNIATASLMA